MLHTFPLFLTSLSKHLLVFKDVFKTSSRHALKTLQYFFSVTIFRSSTTSWRRLAKTSSRLLEDVLKTSRKTSWRRLGRRKIVTLKTYWRRLQDMSWIPSPNLPLLQQIDFRLQTSLICKKEKNNIMWDMIARNFSAKKLS